MQFTVSMIIVQTSSMVTPIPSIMAIKQDMLKE